MKTIPFKKVGFVVLWVTSLMLAAQWGHTQTPTNSLPAPGTIISGNDIGFRFEGLGGHFEGLSGEGSRGSGAFGVWMVKVNGAWTPVLTPAIAQPLVAR